MKTKRILASILALTLTAGFAAGCSSNTGTGASSQSGAASSAASGSAPAKSEAPQPTGEEAKRLENLTEVGTYPVVKEPITLKMMGARGGSQGEWEEMKFFKVLSEKTGVQFDITTAPKDNWDEKKNLAFASNDLPDFFFCGYLKDNDEINYGKQGLLQPLGDMIENHAPNLKALLDADTTTQKAITTLDGNIYSTPYIDDMERNLTQKIWLNKAWLDKLSLPVPTTLDEFYTVLKAIKEKDPNGNGNADEIPITWTENGFRKTLSWWGIGCDIDSYLGNHDGKVYYAPLEPAYKDYLAYYNKLYQEGLVDNEAFTQTTQELKAKGKEEGLILGAFVEAGPFIVVPNENNEDYIALPPLKSPDGKQMWVKGSGVKRGTFAITNKNKYPEATMRMIDWVYSKEGSLTCMRGVEGEDFKYTNEAKTECELVIPEGFASFEEYRAKKLTPNSGCITPGIGGGTLPAVVNPLNTYIDNQVKESLVPYWAEPYPLVYLEGADQKEVASIGADINNYTKEMSARFITGDLSLEKDFEGFLAELKKMNAERYVEVYQKAYDAWKAQ